MYVEYVLHTKIVPSSSRRGEAPIGLLDSNNQLQSKIFVSCSKMDSLISSLKQQAA
jgi:hypothetical protein